MLFDINCVSQRNYGYQKQSSTYRLPALKGRPRYRLRDSFATYILTTEFDFTDQQYKDFQEFWYNDIAAGTLSFEMRLSLDDPAVYQSGNEIYQVHATGGFSSTYTSFGYWQVSFQVEVAGGFRPNITNCDVIYGGPISDPATDVVYGGPISNRATDTIVPCPDLTLDG